MQNGILTDDGLGLDDRSGHHDAAGLQLGAASDDGVGADDGRIGDLRLRMNDGRRMNAAPLLRIAKVPVGILLF